MRSTFQLHSLLLFTLHVLSRGVSADGSAAGMENKVVVTVAMSRRRDTAQQPSILSSTNGRQKNKGALATKFQIPVQNLRGGLLYTMRIGVGTPPQEQEVQLDTGSSDLWISASDCDGCGGIRRFYQDRSSTYTDSCSSCGGTSDYLDSYGDGSYVLGTIFEDRLDIGGVSISTPVTMGNARYASKLSGLGCDGVLGLGLPPLAVYTKHAPYELLTNQLQIQNSFSLFLVSSENGSSITFGGYDSEILGSRPISYVDVSETKYGDSLGYNFWGVHLMSMKLGDQEILRNCSKTFLDSGTSLIILPMDQGIKLFQHMNDSASGGCDFEIGSDDGNSSSAFICQHSTNLTALPSLSIFLGDHHRGDLVTLTITAEKLFLELQDDEEENAQSSYFQLGIGLSNSSQEVVLGDTFLRQYYTLFDKERMRVGFAALSSASANHSDGDPGNNKKSSFSEGQIFLLVGAILGSLVVTLFLCLWCRNIFKVSNIFPRAFVKEDESGSVNYERVVDDYGEEDIDPESEENGAYYY